MFIRPQTLDGFSFEAYYTDCRIDGVDHWDALWYTLNYLPIRFELPF